MKKPCDPSEKPLPDGLIGQPVTVALNLHNGCYTVSIKREIQGYTRALWLGDVTTKVLPGGYNRCRTEQTRNVHAFLMGTLLGAGEELARSAPPAGSRRITYHCKSGPPCFYFADDGQCLVSAREALMLPDGVWVAPDTYKIVVQTQAGPMTWQPYMSREAAELALPGIQRLRIQRLIKDTWEILPLHGGAEG